MSARASAHLKPLGGNATQAGAGGGGGGGPPAADDGLTDAEEAAWAEAVARIDAAARGAGARCPAVGSAIPVPPDARELLFGAGGAHEQHQGGTGAGAGTAAGGGGGGWGRGAPWRRTAAA